MMTSSQNVRRYKRDDDVREGLLAVQTKIHEYERLLGAFEDSQPIREARQCLTYALGCAEGIFSLLDDAAKALEPVTP
jgi:hypothetical protein